VKDLSAMSISNLILDNLNTAVIVLDTQLHIRYLNSSSESLLECSLQKYQDKPLNTVLFLHDEWENELKQCLENATPFTRRQTEINSRITQRSMIADYTVTPLLHEQQRLLLIEMQALDRLLRISREETLLSNDQISRTFIRGLAHEIKNPLGGIRGAAQLLARELVSSEQKDYTQVIISEADRLRNLVDRMLGMNRPLQLQELNIHEVLEHVFALVEVDLADGISLIKDYDPSLPNISGDKEQLIQVVLNIIRNAVQALENARQENSDLPPGEIILKTRAQHHYTIGQKTHRMVCRVDIIDNGPGIPEELARNIFYPLISGRPEGSGLGLAIAQSIVIQHNGLIECSSVPGETVFSLYLPLLHSEA
jgi:two-component system nitrogen regulation sensor histidine kinase GlnL